MPQAIRAEGLAELRRDLRAIDKKLPRELNKVQREALKSTALKAGALAPKRSGKLAASIRPYATAKSAGLRSPVVYANAHHWGGTVGPKKTSYIRPTFFAFRAVRGDLPEIVDKLGDGLESLAKRHGFS